MKFTVVIPTRERLDTLKSCLQTCTSQDYDDLEIIVSDNASQDGTEKFVRSLSDPRIRYINTGKRVGMSQNWEFALSHVRDGFITFLGDDDGLLPSAILKANQILGESELAALVWRKANYCWPSHIDQNFRNLLVVPLGKGTEVRDSNAFLHRLLKFDSSLEGLPYEHLPCLYNSFVAISAIDTARARSGRFFCSQIPDVYSAIALTSSIPHYIYSHEPLSLNGASKHSGGTSTMKEWGRGAAALFVSEENIPFHSDLFLAPSLPLIIVESVWQVRDNVLKCENYDVDIDCLISCALRGIDSLSSAGRLAVEKSLGQIIKCRMSEPRPDLASFRRTRKLSLDPLRMLRRIRSVRKTYTKRLELSGAQNVFDASIVCQKFLDNRISNFEWAWGKLDLKINLLRNRWQK